jgi:hypothetical protein
MKRQTILIWSAVISLLTVLSSVVGLADMGVYARETQNWTLQAQGQDLGNLLAVGVLMLAAVRHRKGSHRAGLVWLGALLYLVYAFIVYAMAVHLNDLFLVYVAVLGLSAWALIFNADNLRHRGIAAPIERPRPFAGWVLIATGTLFAGLWLSELLPALVTGKPPSSLSEAGLPVNPIHVIDLSMVLPGFLIAGIAALRGREHGLFWLVPWLVFSALMGSSIIAALVLVSMAGDSNTVPPTAMVSAVVLAALVALGGHLRTPAHPSEQARPMTHSSNSPRSRL